nr:hypothetical protein [Sicyoidochytrium minutum DNA virus]
MFSVFRFLKARKKACFLKIMKSIL